MKLRVMVVLEGEDTHAGGVVRVRVVVMMVGKVKISQLVLPSWISHVLQAWNGVEGTILIRNYCWRSGAALLLIIRSRLYILDSRFYLKKHSTCFAAFGGTLHFQFRYAIWYAFIKQFGNKIILDNTE